MPTGWTGPGHLRDLPEGASLLRPDSTASPRAPPVFHVVGGGGATRVRASIGVYRCCIESHIRTNEPRPGCSGSSSYCSLRSSQPFALSLSKGHCGSTGSPRMAKVNSSGWKLVGPALLRLLALGLRASTIGRGGFFLRLHRLFPLGVGVIGHIPPRSLKE